MFRRSIFLVLLGVAASSGQPPTPSGEAREPLAHEWRLIDGRHWQIVSPSAIEDVAVTDASEGTRGHCTEGMVEVQGQMMAEGSGYFDVVEALQKKACVDWINRTFPERCARFDAERWKALAADIPRRPMHFCIDRFEYPNRRGAYPWIMVDWNEARGICARDGKRPCSEAEWTFACEGSEALPYPYGYERDADACVIDHAWRPYDAEALFPPARTERGRSWTTSGRGRPRGRDHAAGARSASTT